jgi:ech hydrogenase subunit D
MENEIIINKNELLPTIKKELELKKRFITATCLDAENNFEIIYTFAPNDSVSPLTNIRVVISKTETLPSISGIYSAAVITENEMMGDFKIQIDGLPLDYQGKLMHTKNSMRFPLTQSPPAQKAKEGEVKP